MIINFFLNIIVLIIGAVFSWLPQVTTLPTINDYDIDAALVSGVGQLKSFEAAFWPIGIMVSGALTLLGYYSVKMVLRFIFGSRAPY